MNKYLIRPWHLYRRKRYFRNYLERCERESLSPKLHVGCGNRPIAGWCNIDVAHLNEEVQFVDAFKSLPFAESSFQYIFSEHFIEHLSLEQGIRFFNEAYRILKPGGILRTATPNLDSLCELREPKKLDQQRYLEYVVQNFVPGQPKSYVTAMNLLFYGWGHRFIYNPSFMVEILMQSGFKKFQVYRVGESQVAELQKIEQHGKSVPAEINELETFVLEALK